MNNRKLVFSIILLLSLIFFFLVPTQATYAYFTDNQVIKSDLQLKTGNVKIDSTVANLQAVVLEADNQTSKNQSIKVINQGTLPAQVFYKVEVTGTNWQNYFTIQVGGVTIGADKSGLNQFLVNGGQNVGLTAQGTATIPVTFTKIKNQETADTSYQVKVTAGLIQSNIGEIKNKLTGFYDSQEKVINVTIPKEPVRSNWPVNSPFNGSSKMAFTPLYYRKTESGSIETSVAGTIFIKYQKNQLVNIESVKNDIAKNIFQKTDYKVTQIEYVPNQGFILMVETTGDIREDTGYVQNNLNYNVLHSTGVFDNSDSWSEWIQFFGYKVLTQGDYLYQLNNNIDETSKILTSETGTRITLGVNSSVTYNNYNRVAFSNFPNLTVTTDGNFTATIDPGTNEILVKQSVGLSSIAEGKLNVRSNGKLLISRTLQSIPVSKTDWWSSLSGDSWSSPGDKSNTLLADKSKVFTFNLAKKVADPSPVLYFKVATGFPVKYRSDEENKNYSVTQIDYSPDGQYLRVVLKYNAQDQYQTQLTYSLYAGDLRENYVVNHSSINFQITTVNGTQSLQRNMAKPVQSNPVGEVTKETTVSIQPENNPTTETTVEKTTESAEDSVVKETTTMQSDPAKTAEQVPETAVDNGSSKN